uniref:Acyl carrier protein n=1 Tax=Ignavibacterium album TaxID=591197 RepID=A0A832DHR8_9BACT
MISDKLKKVILTTLNLDDYNITEEMTADQVPGWDSLSHLNVITAVEKEFGIRFKTLELLKLKNIGELQQIINQKLGTNN